MDLDPIRNKVRTAIFPLKPAGSQSAAPDNVLFDAKRTEAGRQLPAYYLVYFLLVDLLGFKNLGQFEKVAWSVPVDFQGQHFSSNIENSGSVSSRRNPPKTKPQLPRSSD